MAALKNTFLGLVVLGIPALFVLLVIFTQTYVFGIGVIITAGVLIICYAIGTLISEWKWG